MKKYYALVLLVSTIMLYSCQKNLVTDVDTTNETQNNETQDFYYVKYQITGSTYFYIDGVSYNTEKGTYTESLPAVGSYEQICGPVNKYFTAKISLTGYRGSPHTNAVKIYISKNNSPFAIKSLGQYSAEYTIDY